MFHKFGEVLTFHPFYQVGSFLIGFESSRKYIGTKIFREI